MKRAVSFSAICAVLATVSLCAFASSESPEPKLLRIDIIGPNSVPEDTQNIFHIVAVYDDGSEIEITADANVAVTPDKCWVTNLGGIVETFKLKTAEKQFTIYASYQGLEVQKPVTVYGHKQENNEQ